MNRVTSQALVASVALCAMVAGCGGAASTGVSNDESFVSVPRNSDAQRQQDRQNVNGQQGSADQEEFYLVLNKKELGNKWFLSAYLKQYFPGNVSYGAARSLGTKVVNFQVHNGKLFVLDASGAHKDSETFDPTLIVDAYPVVHDAALTKQFPTDKWVIFDPAAGLNRFGVVGDDSAQYGQQFFTDLSFAQRFNKTTDGVTFEQVFTGYANLADPSSGGQGQPNEFRGSGTLGIGLRRYSEGKGFTPAPDSSQVFYFKGEPVQVPNTGSYTQPNVRWNIKQGMTPIKWLISDKVKLTEAAYHGKYDVTSAVKAAVENWNAVFGFKALEAVVAPTDASYADDMVNEIIWDTDPSVGYAFANWRNNPITGEIRGASVYINSSWVDDADQYFPDDKAPTAPTVKRQKQPKMQMLQWQSMPQQSLCKMWLPRFRGDADFADASTGLNSDPTTTLTKKQKVEQFITHVVLHEIGHTLGLRHNFAGSLVPPGAPMPSTSVMDYLLNNDSYPMNNPGTYDIDAVKYLYGLSTAEPQQAFCNDSGVGHDPMCARFDRGNDPLNKFYGKYYTAYLNKFFQTQNIFYLLYWDYWLNKTLNFVRAGQDDATKKAALQLALGLVSAPVPAAELGQNAQMGPMIDLVTQWIFLRLYLDPASARGEINNDPDSSLEPRILAELKGNLTNVDGIRSYPARRLAVDILKKLQDIDSLDILLKSKATVQAARATLTGADAELTDDLLARIDAATHPYFVY